MEKSENSKFKDALLHRGRIWVRDAFFDVRQESGVRFGGRYMTPAEYSAYRITRRDRGDGHGS